MLRHLLVATALIGSASGAALAEDNAVEVIHIEYRTTDLANNNARDRLDTRVRRAIRRLCDNPGRTSFANMRLERECRATAEQRANLQLNRTLASNEGDWAVLVLQRDASVR